MTIFTSIVIGVTILFVVACIYLINKKRGNINSIPPSQGSCESQKQESIIPEKDSIYVSELETELSPNGLKLWKRLVTIHFGNTKGAKNLVFYEKKTKPNARMEELIQAAINQWEKDNNLH